MLESSHGIGSQFLVSYSLLSSGHVGHPDFLKNMLGTREPCVLMDILELEASKGMGKLHI